MKHLTHTYNCFNPRAQLGISSAHDDKNYKHGDNKIFYSAFNSTFIDPDIAVANKIVRGKDKGLVNIAVVRGIGKGQPALISGMFTIFSDEPEAGIC